MQHEGAAALEHVASGVGDLGAGHDMAQRHLGEVSGTPTSEHQERNVDRSPWAEVAMSSSRNSFTWVFSDTARPAPPGGGYRRGVWVDIQRTCLRSPIGPVL